jgi:hypothetical protein
MVSLTSGFRSRWRLDASTSQSAKTASLERAHLLDLAHQIYELLPPLGHFLHERDALGVELGYPSVEGDLHQNGDALLLAEVVHISVPDSGEVYDHAHGYAEDLDDFDCDFEVVKPEGRGLRH